MADSGWSIRFFQGNNYSDAGTIGWVSNFKKTNPRQLDSVIAFNGMYGIDNFLIWNIHKNLPSYDFSTVGLNLRLFMYKNPEVPYFQDFYRVQDVKFNPNKSQYTLYAISETSVLLHTKLVSHKITSLSYKEDRKAKDVLEEVLEDNNIFRVVFHEDNERNKKMVHYEYRYFAIDPEWTVLDFIQYICNDNMYEWCLTKTIDSENEPSWWLHFGHELKHSMVRNATKEFNQENDSISHTKYGMKITTNGSPMEVLAHWEEKLRCVWAKHSAGVGGGISKGAFVPIDSGHFDKFLYFRTLEGDLERFLGSRVLSEKKTIPSITLGNILKDEGDPIIIDEVSIQKNPEKYAIREPHNILIDRGDELTVQHLKEKPTRSTPYLDDGAGLFFPSSKLDNPPPNSLIFNVGGKTESTVIGGFVMGSGREGFVIPKKEKGDLRLQLPNGWCLYIKEDGTTYVQNSNADSQSVPTEANTQIFLGSDGSVKFAGGGHKISRDTHKHNYQHLHTTGNMGLPIPPQTSTIPGAIQTDATTDNTVKTEGD